MCDRGAYIPGAGPIGYHEVAVSARMGEEAVVAVAGRALRGVTAIVPPSERRRGSSTLFWARLARGRIS